MSRFLSVVRHRRLTLGQASAAVVTTAPTPTLNQTADVAPVRPRGVRTIRRHARIYFGKPATTQLVSEDFYAALNARMDGAFAAVTTEASARLTGDSAVASSVTSLSSSFTTYQTTANGRLGTLEGTTGTLGTRMTTAEASIVTANAAITSGDAAVASTVTSLNASFTSYQTTANGRLSTLEGTAGTLGTRMTTAEANITSANTARADGDAAVAATVTALNASFTSYQTTANGRLGTLEGTTGTLGTRMTTAEANITSANTARADGDAAVAATVTSLNASFTSYQTTANGRLSTLEGTTGTLGTRMTTAEANITSANTARADGDAAVAATVTALNASFTSYQTTANGRLSTLEGTTGTLGTRMTSAEANITSANTARADGDAAVAATVTSLNASFTTYQTTANGRLGALEGTTGTLGTRMTSAEASITNEATTRANADSALSSTITTVSAASSAAQSTANTGVSNAAAAQGTANTALANAAAAQATANTATASITTETTARTSSDIDVLRKASQQRVLYQSYGPPVDEFLPAYTNRIMNADGRLRNANRTVGWNSGGYTGQQIGIAGAPYALQGGVTWFSHIPLATVGYGGLYFDFNLNNGTNYWIPVTAGTYYEASVYIGAHRCNGYITIAWFNSSYAYITEISNVQVGENDGFRGNSDTAPGLGNYKRSYVIGQAPAGAAYVTVYVRGYALATASYPYLFMTLPYFGACRAGQSTPSDWSNGPDVLLVRSDDNNRLYRWTGGTWALADDTRIAATASQTTSLQTTVNGHTSSITSQQTSINGLSALATLRVNGGGAIAGYDIYAGGGSSSFKIQAENFEIVGSGGSAASPFRVSGGVTYINEARIANGAMSEITAGMAAGYVDLAVTVEAGAKLVFILSTLGGSLQPDLQLYDLTGGAAVANITPSSYSFDLYISSGPDSGYYSTQYIRQATTYQWVIAPGYTGYRAFRLRNNTGNLTSGYSTVVMTIMQFKK